MEANDVRVREQLERLCLVLEERPQLGLDARLRLELLQRERGRLLTATRALRIPEEPGAVHGAHGARADARIDDDLAVAAVDVRTRPEGPALRARRLQTAAVRTNGRAVVDGLLALNA